MNFSIIEFAIIFVIIFLTITQVLMRGPATIKRSMSQMFAILAIIIVYGAIISPVVGDPTVQQVSSTLKKVNFSEWKI